MISALFASESILPQETTSAGSPRPRKLNVDSMVIQLLIEEITTTIVIEPGWTVDLHKTGTYVITADKA